MLLLDVLLTAAGAHQMNVVHETHHLPLSSFEDDVVAPALLAAAPRQPQPQQHPAAPPAAAAAHAQDNTMNEHIKSYAHSDRNTLDQSKYSSNVAAGSGQWWWLVT